MRIRQTLTLMAKFAVAGGLIWFLLSKGLLDPALFKMLLAPKVLTLGLSMIGVTLFLQAWRWQILLTVRDFKVSLYQANKLYLIGGFFNYALPGAVGGDVVKAFYLVRDYPKRRMEAVLTVVIDRLLGLYSTLVVAVVAIGLDWHLVMQNNTLKALSISTLAAFVFMSLFWITAFSHRVKKLVRLELFLQRLPMGMSLARAYKAAQAYGDYRGTFAFTLLLSFIALLISIGFMMLVGVAVGETDIGLSTFLFCVPLGFIASSLPISPAGIGVGQLAFLVLFQMHSGKVSSIGQTAITAFQAALFAWGLVGAVFYLMQRRTMSIPDEVSSL